MKRARIVSLLLIVALILSCTACGNAPTDVENNVTPTPAPTEQAEPATPTPEPATPTPVPATPTPTVAPTSIPSVTDNPSATDLTTEAQKEEEPVDPYAIVDKVPLSAFTPKYMHGSKIEEITYTTKAYYGNEEELTKKAFVYLPANYDESKQYNVLYLMHGIGGNEREWGMVDITSKVKAMMDNLVEEGIIEPFIIVAPNGRSSADFANTNADFNAFYSFGKELRNDLIPYIDANFATYAEYSEDGYDLTAARDHRALAGLSMGGMQTTNIGMCECLDILSWFGAFSAAPTTYTASKIASILQQDFEDYTINYYYALCGTGDGIALASARSAVTGLTALTDKLTDGENFTWQTRSGGHDFDIWYLGFYNFAKIVFR